MRPTLLPGLLDAVQQNFTHGTRDVSLFETGRVFAPAGADEHKPVEREALALLTTGGVLRAGRAEAARETDFYDLKGALQSAVEAMHLPPLSFEAAAFVHLREGQSASVKSGERAIGSIGRLSDAAIPAGYKFRQPIYVAEIDLGLLLEAADAPVRYQPLPRFPGVERDLSLLLDRGITLAQVTESIKELPLAHLRNVSLVDVYEGANLPAGKRSLTLRVEYRADDRTLRDAEVDEMQRGIVATLALKFGAQLRQ
jgi:phenylalanyl-tRNA synthetase beta chain